MPSFFSASYLYTGARDRIPPIKMFFNYPFKICLLLYFGGLHFVKNKKQLLCFLFHGHSKLLFLLFYIVKTSRSCPLTTGPEYPA